MKRHIQSVHEGVKFDCHKCEFQTSAQGSLWEHKRTIHEQNTPSHMSNENASVQIGEGESVKLKLDERNTFETMACDYCIF